VIWGIVALSIAVLLLGVALAAMLRRPKDESVSLLLQHQLTELNRTVADITKTTGGEIEKLNEKISQRLKEATDLMQGTHQTVGARLDKNSELFTHLHERLGRLEVTGQQIQSVGQEIARLQEILRAPKLRGNLGELFLEELLSQILPPPYYQMQYGFRDGLKVDAVIRLPQGNLVPVDAKFPLENFQRMIAPEQTEAAREQFRKTFSADFKRHVDHIAAKYIRPDEGTLDFALLYVPAENVYYEAILRDDQFGQSRALNSYALAKKVIPVSPNSFYAYLQAILLGLRGLKIESQAKEIFAFLARTRSDLSRMKEEWELVGKHLTNARSAYDKSEKRLDQVLDRVNSLEGMAEPVQESAKPIPISSSNRS
jgi:DNA recombination protein RmuC